MPGSPEGMVMSDNDDLLISPDALKVFAASYLEAMGCTPAVAADVAEHLVEADLVRSLRRSAAKNS